MPPRMVRPGRCRIPVCSANSSPTTYSAETTDGMNPMKVMVLAGGPDRERPVSLLGGQQVAKALQHAGHQVRLEDIAPGDMTALDRFTQWGGDVVFPVLHGTWGEGGPLQQILEQRGLSHVGSMTQAARTAMDKPLTKKILRQHDLPTPEDQMVRPDEPCTIRAPLVVKPPREGSSIDVVICQDASQTRRARQQLEGRHARLMLERFISGLEVTVGILDEEEGRPRALPAIQIVPATTFYDYEAKYRRNDTRYRFDVALPPDMLQRLEHLALCTHQVVGCRHMSRVDFIVDRQQHRPWILEVNTIPGFTTHSLLPMAAARAGLDMRQLVDHLVHLAVATTTTEHGGVPRRQDRPDHLVSAGSSTAADSAAGSATAWPSASPASPTG